MVCPSAPFAVNGLPHTLGPGKGLTAGDTGLRDGPAPPGKPVKQQAAQLLTTAATLERGFQAFRGSCNLQVFQPQINELRRLHLQWQSDLDSFKNSLRAQGAEPKALNYVSEAFERLAERIKRLAD